MRFKYRVMPLLGVTCILILLYIGGCKGTYTPASTPSSSPASSPHPTNTPIPEAWPEEEKQVVLFFRDEALWRTSVKGGEAEKLTDRVPITWADVELWFTVLNFPPRISPNGRWLIASDLSTWWLFDLAGQNNPAPVTCGGAPSWSPDSEQFTCILGDELYIYNIHDQEALILFKKDGLKHMLVAWSPDGRYIATGRITCEPGTTTCHGEVWISEPAQGVSWMLGEFDPPLEAPPDALQWFPDSEAVFMQATPGLILSLRDHNSRPIDVRPLWWSPNLDYGVGWRLDVLRADGAVLHTLPCDDACICKMGAWSPDTERLAYSARCGVLSKLYVVNVETGELLWEQEAPDFRLDTVRWSADGQYLLLDGMEGELFPIWRLRADGTGKMETLVEEGFLLQVIPQWGQ